jgi:hypothetical protein
MKKLIALSLMMSMSLGLMAQKKVKEKDLIGEWELVIDIDMKDIEEELEEEENWLARSFAKSVSSFALDIVESINVDFEFRENGDVRIDVEVMGEREVEYAEWYINKDGELIIEAEDERDQIKIDDIDVFMMKDGNLVAYEKGRRGKLYEKEEIYLKRKR